MPAALDGEPDRPVEGRHFIEPQPLGLPFPEANPGHSLPVLELVVHRRGVAPQPHHGRQRREALPGRLVYQRRRIERDPSPLEVLPALHLTQLR